MDQWQGVPQFTLQRVRSHKLCCIGSVKYHRPFLPYALLGNVTSVLLWLAEGAFLKQITLWHLQQNNSVSLPILLSVFSSSATMNSFWCQISSCHTAIDTRKNPWWQRQRRQKVKWAEILLYINSSDTDWHGTTDFQWNEIWTGDRQMWCSVSCWQAWKCKYFCR